MNALLGHLVGARVYGEFRQVAFTPWRGAYGSVPPDATGFVHRTATYLVNHTVLVGPNGAARRGGAALRWLTGSWSTVHSCGTGGAYPNFPDPALPDWMTAYYGTNANRLREVKAAYDPDGVFHFAQSIR